MFGCGGERDFKKRPLMAEVASRNCKKIYVTDDNPRNESPKKIRGEIIMQMQVQKMYEYNPYDSEYELAKDNKTFLVVWGDGYMGNEEVPENEISHIESLEDEYFVIHYYTQQRLIYFKEIELAEEWDLRDSFLDELFNAKEGDWLKFSDLSGTIWFKCMREK